MCCFPASEFAPEGQFRHQLASRHKCIIYSRRVEFTSAYFLWCNSAVGEKRGPETRGYSCFFYQKINRRNPQKPGNLQVGAACCIGIISFKHMRRLLADIHTRAQSDIEALKLSLRSISYLLLILRVVIPSNEGLAEIVPWLLLFLLSCLGWPNRARCL